MPAGFPRAGDSIRPEQRDSPPESWHSSEIQPPWERGRRMCAAEKGILLREDPPSCSGWTRRSSGICAQRFATRPVRPYLYSSGRSHAGRRNDEVSACPNNSYSSWIDKDKRVRANSQTYLLIPLIIKVMQASA